MSEIKGNGKSANAGVTQTVLVLGKNPKIHPCKVKLGDLWKIQILPQPCFLLEMSFIPAHLPASLPLTITIYQGLLLRQSDPLCSSSPLSSIYPLLPPVIVSLPSATCWSILANPNDRCIVIISSFLPHSALSSNSTFVTIQVQVQVWSQSQIWSLNSKGLKLGVTLFCKNPISSCSTTLYLAAALPKNTTF